MSSIHSPSPSGNVIEEKVILDERVMSSIHSLSSSGKVIDARAVMSSIYSLSPSGTRERTIQPVGLHISLLFAPLLLHSTARAVT